MLLIFYQTAFHKLKIQLVCSWFSNNDSSMKSFFIVSSSLLKYLSEDEGWQMVWSRGPGGSGPTYLRTSGQLSWWLLLNLFWSVVESLRRFDLKFCLWAISHLYNHCCSIFSSNQLYCFYIWPLCLILYCFFMPLPTHPVWLCCFSPCHAGLNKC